MITNSDSSQGTGQISHLRKNTTHKVIFLCFDMSMVYTEKKLPFLPLHVQDYFVFIQRVIINKNIVCGLKVIISPTVHSLCYGRQLFTKHINNLTLHELTSSPLTEKRLTKYTLQLHRYIFYPFKQTKNIFKLT